MPVPNNDPIDTTACLQIFKLFTKTTQNILGITWVRLQKVQNELIITNITKIFVSKSLILLDLVMLKCA